MLCLEISGGIVAALPPGNTVARHAPSGSMSPSSAGRHIRPVILIAPSGQQVSSAKPAQADLAAKQTEPPAQKRHEAASTVHGRQDMVRQDNKARPVRDSTVEHPVQDKPDMSRPAVRDSTPKRALVKGNGTRRSKRKYTSAPKSTGKRGNSAESKKERGGSK
ncbi:MAG: hypothetical protein ACLTWR_10360 [Agathobaculum desmolans]|uniref:hypothetical protein n=1 Tax=Agathobaculum desmolans TaxID=39484 RepID=UPI00399348FF